MCKFVAEIGINHLGSEDCAHITLNALLETSVDAITFQIRRDDFYESGEPSHRRLSDGFYVQACERTHHHHKGFGIATCEAKVVPFLDSVGVDFWKTLSWDFKNHALIEALLATGKTTFMSTGTASMEDINTAAREYGDIVFIHTQLSEMVEDVNLKALDSIRERTGKPVAFGLHCSNHDVLKVALGYEPEALFFYVKERNLTGLFDDAHAVFTDHVGGLVDELKVLLGSLGTGRKETKELPDWVVR
jgi:sialic acid synthase SpsE